MAMFTQVAYRVLQESGGKPLHSKEITSIAIKRGYLVSEGKTPEKTMSARLQDDIKHFGDLSRFKKTGPNEFQLNEKRAEVEEISRTDKVFEELDAEEQKRVDGGYTGKAGEHAVIAELLFRGYQAALMSVDTGIDIVAIKDRRTFGIQVKTRNLNKKSDSFEFNLRAASFERHNEGSTFYFFLLKEGEKLDYLILPFHEVEKNIEKDYIYTVGEGKMYRIRIRRDGDDVYLGRKQNNMTYYLNRWQILK